jgi:hypothetical protein
MRKTVQMEIRYFKTRDEANRAVQGWIDSVYTNRFQDAFAISRLNLVETGKGLAWQRGDYGSWLLNQDFVDTKKE